MKNEKTAVDIDYAEAIVPKSARRGIVTMFMIMLGFTFFSASMWVGQQLADGLDFQGFVVSMIVGGVILSLYTGLLGYVGAETGMSLDLFARKAFGVKGSYLPSAMISFTQIGWFGVGIAMFAIPVANELLGGSKTAEWALVIIAGICMTASAYFGIKSLTIVSYIAVPMVAVLGTVAMVLAVMRGDGTIVDQFAKSSGTLTVIGGAGLVVGSFVSGGTATPNFSRFAKSGKVGAITTVIAFFIGNSLMFFFGGVSSVYVGGNDIFEVFEPLMFTRFRFPMSCTSSKFAFMISGTRDSKTAFPVAFRCLFRTPCPSSATTMPMTVSAVTEVKIPIAVAAQPITVRSLPRPPPRLPFCSSRASCSSVIV